MEPARIFWERLTASSWSSPVGYVSEDKGLWTAYVYRNQRTGRAWTERRPGFQTAAAARRWVENEAEE